MNNKQTFMAACIIVFAATVSADNPSGGPYEMVRITIEGGGQPANGGAYSLRAAIGQADAGLFAGGAYELAGGFWFAEPVGDCDATGLADLLDFAEMSDCLNGPAIGYTAPDCNCFDFDDDGDTDLLDFAELQAVLED